MKDPQPTHGTTAPVGALAGPSIPDPAAGSRRSMIVDPNDPDRPMILLCLAMLCGTLLVVTLALAYFVLFD